MPDKSSVGVKQAYVLGDERVDKVAGEIPYLNGAGVCRAEARLDFFTNALPADLGSGKTKEGERCEKRSVQNDLDRAARYVKQEANRSGRACLAVGPVRWKNSCTSSPTVCAAQPASLLCAVD